VSADAGISAELLGIIVCPACHGALDVTHDNGPELLCRDCGLAYPVRDGIPVLLVDEARPTR
jgi:uncharacterized protein YbaR (Trm112 family)